MSGPGRRKTTDIEDTFRDFWSDRPVRPRRGGKIAGVAAALGNRYGIDPILVRVAFVVGAFYGGAGIVLYLLGWLALPKQDSDRPDAGGPRRTSGPLLVILALLLIPAVFVVTDFGGVVGLVIGIAALYLLHRNYGHRGRDQRQSAPEPATEPTESSAPNTWVYPSARSDDESESTAQPPSWDPLGAAPFAWDLPEPDEPAAPPQRPRRRRSVTLVTLALALIAGGVVAATDLSPVAALAVPLGVLGLGMIAGAFLQGGRGLIAFAIPVAAMAIVLPATPWRGTTALEAHPRTAVEAQPQTIAEVQQRYTESVGRIGLDLTDLTFTDNDRLHTTARVGRGEISVRIPENVDAIVTCSTDRGRVDCLDAHRGGPDVSERATSTGADGRGGGQIVLDLHAGTGHVEVTRG